jgi:hypothetical protein
MPLGRPFLGEFK